MINFILLPASVDTSTKKKPLKKIDYFLWLELFWNSFYTNVKTKNKPDRTFHSTNRESQQSASIIKSAKSFSNGKIPKNVFLSKI